MLLVSPLWAAAPTSAQSTEGFRLNRYHAPPTVEDGLVLEHPSTLGHLRWSGQLTLDYGHRPLVAGVPGENPDDRVSIVDGQLAAHAAFALGISDRFQVFASVPVTLFQPGHDRMVGATSFTAPDSAGVGDPAVGGSVHLLGGDQGLSLGLGASVLIPVGSTQALAGDGGVGVRGQLLASFVGEWVTLTTNLGAAYRPDRTYASARVGSELLFAAGVEVPVGKLRLMGEFTGATGLTSDTLFSALTTPMEVLAGARYALPLGLHLGGGVGFGITETYGVPTVRGLVTVGYAPPREEAVGDRDEDGILDPEDDCPDEPEDIDGFEDEDGCPDPDNDHDGIPDVDDSCPLEPEDIDGFEDEDGCPDPDNDQDGIFDTDDSCPDEPEDRDGFEDEDGCPDLDNDQDGIPDVEDSCPDEPETVNGFEDEDGCPDEVPSPGTELPDSTLFPFDSHAVRRDNHATLQRLVDLMDHNPELVLVIEGHASLEGSDEYNQTLSENRARAVVRWLVGRGVSESRLRWEGHGVRRPEASNDTEEGRARNRRVYYRIEAE